MAAGGNEELVSMGTVSVWGNETRSADGRWRWLYNNVNVTDATDWTLKTDKMINFTSYIFYHNF